MMAVEEFTPVYMCHRCNIPMKKLAGKTLTIIDDYDSNGCTKMQIYECPQCTLLEFHTLEDEE